MHRYATLYSLEEIMISWLFFREHEHKNFFPFIVHGWVKPFIVKKKNHYTLFKS